MFMFSQLYVPKNKELLNVGPSSHTSPNSFGTQTFKGVRETVDKNFDIIDGFQTYRNGFGEVCWIFFVIHNHVVYRSNGDIKCEEFHNLFLGNKEDISEYDLEPMIKLFLKDLYNSIERTDGLKINNDYIERVKISVDFQVLEGNTLAVSSGINDDENIRIKIDPSKWKDATSIERWYTIYHELGHDVLNFKHGEGGKMMFNYTFKDYSWYDFEEDRQYMFESYIDKLNQQKSRLN